MKTGLHWKRDSGNWRAGCKTLERRSLVAESHREPSPGMSEAIPWVTSRSDHAQTHAVAGVRRLASSAGEGAASESITSTSPPVCTDVYCVSTQGIARKPAHPWAGLPQAFSLNASGVMGLSGNWLWIFEPRPNQATAQQP